MTAGSEAPHRTIIIQRIAEGGMGYIELIARQTGRFTRLFARKRLHAHLLSDPAFCSMFLDEARVAGLVRHPNVTAAIEVGSDASGPFLLMEYVEGPTVAQIIKAVQPLDDPLPLPLCLSIAAQAARGLHAAHELRAADGTLLALVHRDISPQNLLLGYDGVARVTDFGIAKARGNIEHTALGVLKGNLGYMAPEYLRFEELDRRCDLFALGVVLHELLTRQRLYGGDDATAIARRIVDEPPPDVFEQRDVPPELSQLLFRMLAKDREQRPADALEVASVLESILSDLAGVEGPFDVPRFLEDELGELRVSQRRGLERALAELGSGGQGAPASAAPADAGAGAGAASAVHTESRGVGRRFRYAGLALLGLGAALAYAVVRERPLGHFEPGGARLWSGGWHNCAERAGSLWCWGSNVKGQLADGGTESRYAPVEARLGAFSSLSFGEYHACALRPDASVACWGRNVMWEAGRALPQLMSEPMRVEGLAAATQVVAGRQHACALLADGGVVCWGANESGQLGRPQSSEGLSPGPVELLPAAAELFAGGSGTCARLVEGGFRCWGANESGQLADGTRSASFRPVALPALHGVTSLVLSNNGIAGSSSIGKDGFDCVLHGDGRVSCWGCNVTGQLGDGTREDRLAPTRVLGIDDAVQIALGNVHACALHASGKVSCWGRNEFGAVGDSPMGPSQVRSTPVHVAGIEDAVGLGLGAAHSCARRREGAIACWGVNNFGQLGDGTESLRAAPHPVLGFF